MAETPEVICPECGAKETRKMIGAGSGIVFKGSGFYVTDYKKDSGSKKTSSSTASKSGSSGSKSESAPKKTE